MQQTEKLEMHTSCQTCHSRCARDMQHSCKIAQTPYTAATRHTIPSTIMLQPKRGEVRPLYLLPNAQPKEMQ